MTAGVSGERVGGRAAGVGALAIVVGVGYLQATMGWRQATLFGVGAAAGLVLYHAAFGFTSAWREFIADRRGSGVRAQMVMLALTVVAFVPLLSWGSPVWGQALRGSAAPIGVALVTGAFVFGFGMQLGGGCASGTLYSAGGGSTRMFVTLAFFILGSLAGTAHAPFWETMPQRPAVSLLVEFGPWPAVGVSLAVIAMVFATVRWFESRAHGRVVALADAARGGQVRVFRGPWALMWGAVGLAAVNVATLLLAGRPWGVTSAFALWGAKSAQAAGVDVLEWPYWAVPARAASIAAPVIADVTSVMNFGIMLGAFVAAGVAGRLSPVWRVPARSLLAAAIGGLMLGYGARLASGCNIGAYFSGVASTSLHGWIWFLCAFAGSYLGTRIRPVFGLGR